MPRRPIRRSAGVLAVIAIVALAAAPHAQAQGEGVVVDPDSPAGKEYAIPLEQARDTTSSEDAKRDGAPADLFGAGVTPARPGRDTPDRRSGREGDDGSGSTSTEAPAKNDDDSGLGAAAPGSGDPPEPQRVASAEVASSPWVLGAASALAVLLAGGVLALAARGARRHRPV